MTVVLQSSSIPATGPVALLIATRKGGWFPKGNSGCWSWAIEGPVFLGQMMDHLVRDPRDQGTLLMATGTGDLSPTIYRSTDDGKAPSRRCRNRPRLRRPPRAKRVTRSTTRSSSPPDSAVSRAFGTLARRRRGRSGRRYWVSASSAPVRFAYRLGLPDGWRGGQAACQFTGVTATSREGWGLVLVPLYR
jgi:hypothetical protein